VATHGHSIRAVGSGAPTKTGTVINGCGLMVLLGIGIVGLIMVVATANQTMTFVQTTGIVRMGIRLIAVHWKFLAKRHTRGFGWTNFALTAKNTFARKMQQWPSTALLRLVLAWRQQERQALQACHADCLKRHQLLHRMNPPTHPRRL